MGVEEDHSANNNNNNNGTCSTPGGNEELEMQDEETTNTTKGLLQATNQSDSGDHFNREADNLEKGRGGGNNYNNNNNNNTFTPSLFLTFAQTHQLVHDVHEYGLLDTKRNRLLVYIFLLLIYIGLNVGLLAANFQDQEVIEENYYYSFHMAAFWGIFCFSALEALILIATECVSWNNRLQSSLVLFNVMMSFATALFFTFDPELYEVPAHFMEYSIQVLISGVNVIFTNTYIRAVSRESLVYRLRHLEYVVLGLVLTLSLFQLSLFAGNPAVQMGAERSAHFAEFTNEIFNGLFALLYAILSYTDVRNQLQDHYMKMNVMSSSAAPPKAIY